MFNVGGGEFIVIALIALIVLGPQRLPGAARQVGKALGDLRRLSNGFQSEMRDAFADVDAPAATGDLAPRSEPRSDSTATASVDAAVASVSRPAPRRTAPLRAAPAGERAPLPKGSTARGKGA